MSESKPFTIPSIYGEGGSASNEIDTVLYVLSFLREAMGGYNNELPFTDDAMIGLCMILDGSMDTLKIANGKL